VRDKVRETPALVRHPEVGRGPVFGRMVGQPARAERNDPPNHLLTLLC
jgi:hypothetical protein